MRTYDRDTFLRAKASWESFDYEWKALRDTAASVGIIFAPEGSKWDDRDAEQPSQRAIVWRAMQDNPKKLDAIIKRSHSWGQVVGGIIGMEASLREDADDRLRDDAWDRQDEPNPQQSLLGIGSLFEKVAQSMGYVKKP